MPEPRASGPAVAPSDLPPAAPSTADPRGAATGRVAGERLAAAGDYLAQVRRSFYDRLGPNIPRLGTLAALGGLAAGVALPQFGDQAGSSLQNTASGLTALGILGAPALMKRNLGVRGVLGAGALAALGAQGARAAVETVEGPGGRARQEALQTMRDQLDLQSAAAQQALAIEQQRAEMARRNLYETLPAQAAVASIQTTPSLMMQALQSQSANSQALINSLGQIYAS